MKTKDEKMFILHRTEKTETRVRGKQPFHKTQKWGLGYSNRQDAEEKIKEFQSMPEHQNATFRIEER